MEISVPLKILPLLFSLTSKRRDLLSNDLLIQVQSENGVSSSEYDNRTFTWKTIILEIKPSETLTVQLFNTNTKELVGRSVIQSQDIISSSEFIHSSILKFEEEKVGEIFFSSICFTLFKMSKYLGKNQSRNYSSCLFHT